MAKYILKRKTFDLKEAGENILGGVSNAAGVALDNAAAGTLGAVKGAQIGGAAAGPLGAVVGGIAGYKGTREIGKGLKSAGNSLGATGY